MQNFRRGVVNTSTWLGCELSWTQLGSQPKVDKFDDRLHGREAEDQVLGLDIAVHDPKFVNVHERHQDWVEEFPRKLLIERGVSLKKIRKLNQGYYRCLGLHFLHQGVP